VSTQDHNGGEGNFVVETVTQNQNRLTVPIRAPAASVFFHRQASNRYHDLKKKKITL